MFQIKIDKNSEMRGHTKSSFFFFEVLNNFQQI